MSIDSMLSDLAGFSHIEQPDESPEPEDLSDEIRELAIEIEHSIEKWDERIDELPEFESRHKRQQVGGTVLVDEM